MLKCKLTHALVTIITCHTKTIFRRVERKLARICNPMTAMKIAGVFHRYCKPKFFSEQNIIAFCSNQQYF